MPKPQELDLPTVTLRDEDQQDLVIRHKRKGLETKVSRAKLDRWCMKIVRESLTEPSVPGGKE